MSLRDRSGEGRHRRLRNGLQELFLLLVIALTAGAAVWLLLGALASVLVLAAIVLMGMLRPRVPVALILWMYGAEPLPRWAAPQLHRIVDVLSAGAGLSWRPAVYYVATPMANAFVVGPPDRAVLAVTDGLLRLLTGRQLVGVLAHEISHLHNGDTMTMNLSDLVARFAQWLGWCGLWSVLITAPLAVRHADPRPLLLSGVLIVVPTLAALTELALSRSREYDADRDGAVLTGDPGGLAEALLVLDSSEGRIWERILVGRPAPPDPLLLQTHPRTDQRVRRLVALKVGAPSLDTSHRSLSPDYPRVSHRPRLRRTGVRW